MRIAHWLSRSRFTAWAVWGAAWTCVAGGLSWAADKGVETLRIEIDDRGVLESDYALFAQPEECLRMHIRPAEGAGDWKVEARPPGPVRAVRYEIETVQALTVEFTGGELAAALEDGIVWKAPKQPGWGKIRFERKTSRNARPGPAGRGRGQSLGEKTGRIELSVCVLYPFDAQKDESLEGFPLGVYPNPRAPDAPLIVLDNPNLYEPPAWFVKVTTDTANLKVSPNFRLGEFASSERQGEAQFIALDPRLVMFLESLRVAVQAESEKPRTLKILRAYLSPIDRAKLEREGVRYPLFSRYQYGDCAAIIVDGDGDRRMDDLDGDGEISSRDADWLADVCQEVQERMRMFGGIGVARNAKDPRFPDTPFVDVDLRGRKTRW